MATHITIDDITPRIQHTGDGAQTRFTYPFPIFADADLEVYEDAALKTTTTHYTVAGAGNSVGGSVTFVAAPANGVVVTLLRDLAIKRTTDFQEGGAFRAKTINDEMDRMTAGLQQVEVDAGRGLKLSATDTATSVTLPDKTTRAGQLLGFDSNGDPDTSPKTGITGPAGATGTTGPAGADGSGLFDGTEASVTPATGDKVALLDVSDSDNPKYATALNIINLGEGAFEIPIPAAMLNPTTTDVCAALAQSETTTNKVNYDSLDFDATTEEHAYVNLSLPKAFDAGTLTAVVKWAHPTTATNFGVVWEVEILALANDDAIDTAFGTAITVADTGGTTEDIYVSSATADVTPGNAPTKQDFYCIRISRKTGDASDNMAVDAKLI